MNLPIQSQPVNRQVSISKITSNGIDKSGDCGRGRWCCNKGSKNVCIPCTLVDPFFGRCLSPQNLDCAMFGGEPSLSC